MAICRKKYDANVCFISTNNYKNEAIQRRGVEANGAMALQPVEVLGPVKNVIAKKFKA